MASQFVEKQDPGAVCAQQDSFLQIHSQIGGISGELTHQNWHVNHPTPLRFRRESAECVDWLFVFSDVVVRIASFVFSFHDQLFVCYFCFHSDVTIVVLVSYFRCCVFICCR